MERDRTFGIDHRARRCIDCPALGKPFRDNNQTGCPIGELISQEARKNQPIFSGDGVVTHFSSDDTTHLACKGPVREPGRWCGNGEVEVFATERHKNNRWKRLRLNRSQPKMLLWTWKGGSF